MASMALAGLAILVLGDSHMVGKDYLLSDLHNQLTAQGATVDSYAMCGASAGDWVYPVTVSCGRAEREGTAPSMVDYKFARTWNLNSLITKNHPDLIVVELADAMAGYGSSEIPRRWISDEVKVLVDRIKAQNVPCVWVGPVWGREDRPYYKTLQRVKEMSQLLSDTVAPCRFIDSTAFAQPSQWRTIDWEHLTRTGYKQWSHDIAGSIAPFGHELSMLKSTKPAGSDVAAAPAPAGRAVPVAAVPATDQTAVRPVAPAAHQVPAANQVTVTRPTAPVVSELAMAKPLPTDSQLTMNR